MIDIKQFCTDHKIEIPTGMDLSNLYVDIYEKHYKEIKEWETVGPDGKMQKHYTWLYHEKDLKEYFKNN